MKSFVLSNCVHFYFLCFACKLFGVRNIQNCCSHSLEFLTFTQTVFFFYKFSCKCQKGKTSNVYICTKVVRKGGITMGKLLRLVQEPCTARKRKWQSRELMTGQTSFRLMQTFSVAIVYNFKYRFIKISYTTDKINRQITE